MTKEQEAIKAKIRELKATQAVVDDVKAIVQEFAGKVYNCRFDNAIKEKTACYVGHGYGGNWLEIRRCDAPYCESAGLVTMVRKENVMDGKRINAEKLIADIDSGTNSRNKQIMRLSGELTWIEGVVEGINEQIRLLNKMVDSLSSETLDIYKNRFEWCSYRLR